jgi:GT2 family glycosyltransferase
MEAILLTFRLGSHRTFEAVELLLSSVAKDSLAQFFVVLALDSDEIRTKEATMMLDLIGAYCEVFLIANPPRDNNEPFSICQAWNNMAVKAFEKGADWVVLLGDDIEIDCPFHYRVTYRAFLDVSDRLGCSFGFGCPWWNDTSFPGFPTFPVVGKAHYEIFGSLIPSWRKDCFVSQDFDPYLQRLYLKFGAAPLMEHARLRNLTGGNNVNPTRYERIHAIGWRDWVLKDVTPLGDYLRAFGSYERSRSECLLLDVVIPSYRVDITFLRQICSLSVPDRLRTTFIVVVDNPTRLTSLMAEAEPCAAALALESLLVAHSKENTRSGNNIRVRCNEVNMGASATRNRGMDESSAEYILFLDDDVRPNADLLEQYEQELMRLEDDVVGLVGMVRFPRSKDMSVLHAAVLMSYLTFMFEIAANEIYAYPAWGVTANLLVKRLEVRFDTVYAKTGGGEDVDFCLRLLDSSGGRLKSVRGPMVHHAVWPGGFRVLLPHFFHWAVGDGALFQRYTGLCYTSWPNIVETFVVFALCWIVFFRARGLSGHVLIVEALGLFFADFAVEVSNPEERRHKQRLLEHDFSCSYYAAAHLLANLYVVVLECGRLYGHVRRRELLSNACRRFDWHCERLAGAPAKFRRKERTKFLLFLVVTAANLVASSPGLVRKIRRACPVFSSNPGAGEL